VRAHDHVGKGSPTYMGPPSYRRRPAVPKWAACSMVLPSRSTAVGEEITAALLSANATAGSRRMRAKICVAPDESQNGAAGSGTFLLGHPKQPPESRSADCPFRTCDARSHAMSELLDWRIDADVMLSW
jgi:hypothetical protein